MAINRDAYKSLVESVNEAVSAPSVGASKGAARVRGGRTSSTASSKPSNLQWGSSAIGGAMNATELAQWLASQQGSGKQGPSVGVADTAMGVAKGSAAKNLSSVSGRGGSNTQRAAASSSGWGGSGVYGAKNAEDLARILNQMQNDGPSVSTGASKGGMKSRNNPLSSRKPGSTSSSKPAAKKPTVSVADVQEALDILAEAQLNEWPINIGGRTANNASELAQILNSMQNSGKPSGSTPSVSKGVAGAAPRGNLLSNRRPGTTTTAKPAPKAPTVGVGGIGAMSEEWDILDEILAEGLELYGEEGLAEILAHFAETGEMSEELADLLGE
jgi:hypothetical protein